MLYIICQTTTTASIASARSALYLSDVVGSDPRVHSDFVLVFLIKNRALRIDHPTTWYVGLFMHQRSMYKIVPVCLSSASNGNLE